LHLYSNTLGGGVKHTYAVLTNYYWDNVSAGSNPMMLFNAHYTLQNHTTVNDYFMIGVTDISHVSYSLSGCASPPSGCTCGIGVECNNNYCFISVAGTAKAYTNGTIFFPEDINAVQNITITAFRPNDLTAINYTVIWNGKTFNGTMTSSNCGFIAQNQQVSASYMTASATGARNVNISLIQFTDYVMDIIINNSGTSGYSNQTSDLPIGAWCGLNNSACMTNYCAYQYCGLKPAKYECSSDYECYSNSCENSHCSQAGLISDFTQSAKELTGATNTADLTLISIILIVGICAGIVFVTRGHPAGIILSIGLFYSLAFMFMVMGWLSGWVFIAFVLSGLVGMVLLFMFAQQG
jgi:hypothetical protein